MNKNCYRLRRHGRTGQWIAVAEIRSGVACGSAGLFIGRSRLLIRLLPLAGLLMALPARAAIVPDGPQVSAIPAPNGVPVINIAPPDSQGLSRNRFEKLDIEQPGAVFNNSTHDGRSQLAGYILKNPKLGSGPPADSILAEVTSPGEPSRLQGTLEIFGKRAALIIANPNGISVDGLSTLNTRALTLSTGSVRHDNKTLTLWTQQGTIDIGAGGVNTDGLQTFDLIAQSMRINGPIAPASSSPATLRLQAGHNQLDLRSGQITALPAPAATPQTLISASALGAMHGAHIYIQATDAGAGVRLQGSLRSPSDIRVQANGDIVLAHSTARGNTFIKAGQTVTLAQAGNIISGEALSIQTGGQVAFAGNAHANTLHIQAQSLSLTSALLSVEGKNAQTPAAAIQLTGDYQSQADWQAAVPDTSVKTDAQGRPPSFAPDTTPAARPSPRSCCGLLVRQGDTHIQAGTLDNQGLLSVGGGELRIETQGELRNPGIISAQGALTLATQQALHNSGALQGEQLTLASASLSNHGALNAFSGPLTLDLDQTLDNTGTIDAAGELRIRARGGADNSGTLMGDSLSLQADTLHNTGELSTGHGKLTIDVQNDLRNTGRIEGALDTILRAASVRNGDQARLQGKTLALVAASLDNDGDIWGQNAALLAPQRLANTGHINAAEQLDIETGAHRGQGQITGARVRFKTGADLVLDGHAPSATEFLDLVAPRIQIQAPISQTATLRLEAKAGNIDNYAALESGGDIILNAQADINNHDGALIWAQRNIGLKSQRILNHSHGLIYANAAAAIQAAQLLRNLSGRIESRGDMVIDTPKLENLSTLTGSVGFNPKTGQQIGRAVAARTFPLTLIAMELQPFIASEIVSSLAVQQGVIHSGGNMDINQHRRLNQANQVLNQGRLTTQGTQRIDADVRNQSFSRQISIQDYLKNIDGIEIKTTHSAAILTPKTERFASLFDLMQHIFDGQSSTIWGLYTYSHAWYADALASYSINASPRLSDALSHALGADWKGLSEAQLGQRWREFKEGRRGSTMTFYPKLKTTLGGYAGLHVNGSLQNGENVTTLLPSGLDASLQAALEQAIKNWNLPRPSDTGSTPPADNTTPGTEPDSQALFETLIDGVKHRFPTKEAMQNFLAQEAQRKAEEERTRQRAEEQAKRREAAHRQAYYVSTLQDSDFKAALDDTLANHHLFGHSGAAVNAGTPYYESRVPFVKQEAFYGSDYFFEKIGYTPGEKTYVGGDNYFDTILIQRQAERLMGAQYLRQAASGAALAKALIDNAAQARTALSLQVGKALNATQLAGLKDDIVWYVWTPVNGTVVLMPKVYLSDRTVAALAAQQAAGGAVMASGGDIRIVTEHGDVMQNNALTLARNIDIQVQEGDVKIINSDHVHGGIQADQTAHLQGRNLYIKGGILRGRHLELDADRNLEILTGMTTDEEAALVKDHTTGLFAEQALTLKAGQHLNTLGASLSGQQLSLTAQTLNLGEVREISSSQRLELDLGLLGARITQTHQTRDQGAGSTLSARDLKIDVAQDLLMRGGRIQAEHSQVDVGGRMMAAASATHSIYRQQETTFGLLASGRAGAGGKEASFESVGGKMQSHAGDGQMAGAELKFGLYFENAKTESQTTTQQNAQLNLGNGKVWVTKTFDMGGADINADRNQASALHDGNLNITAGDIANTKYLDIHEQHETSQSFFLGTKASAQSSLIDVATHAGVTAQQAAQGREVDPLMTTAQVAGDLSNLLLNDTAELTLSAGMEIGNSKSHYRRTAENTNVVGGNIRLVSNQGDIRLAGTQFSGGQHVDLISARNIVLTSAKTNEKSWGEQHSVSLYMNGSASCNAIQASCGLGVNLSMAGSHSISNNDSLLHNHSRILAQQVKLDSKRDLLLLGARAQASGPILAKVGGALHVQTQLDTQQSKTQGGSWNASMGAAINNRTLGTLTFNLGGTARHEHDNSALAKQIAGLAANDKLDLSVQGNARLTGGEISAAGKGAKVDIKGTLSVADLKEYRDHDGGYAGGSIGISGTTSLPTVSLSGGRIAGEHFAATLHSTIDVGQRQGHGQISTGATEGQLNENVSRIRTIEDDRKWAQNDINITLSKLDLGRKKAKQEQDEGNLDGPLATDFKKGGKFGKITPQDSDAPDNDSPRPMAVADLDHINVTLVSYQRHPSDSTQDPPTPTGDTGSIRQRPDAVLEDSLSHGAPRQPAAGSGGDADLPISEGIGHGMVDLFALGFELRRSGDTNALLHELKYETHTRQAIEDLPAPQREALDFYRGAKHIPGLSFADINTVLRTGKTLNPAHTQPAADLAAAISQALDQLPGASSTSYRWVDGSVMPAIDLLQPGTRFADKALMSTSASAHHVRKAMRAHMELGEPMKPVFFLVEGETGINVGNVTKQSEIIFKPNTIFEVNHREQRHIRYAPNVSEQTDFIVIKESKPKNGQPVLDLTTGQINGPEIRVAAATESASFLNDNPSSPPQNRPQSQTDPYRKRTVVVVGDDLQALQSAERLADKHPANTELRQWLASGETKILRAAPDMAAGPEKIQIVGHGNTADKPPTIGGYSAAELATQIQPLLGHTPAKIALVSCGSGNCPGKDISSLLQAHLPATPVKGYGGNIDVVPDGRKISVESGGLGPKRVPAKTTEPGAKRATDKKINVKSRSQDKTAKQKKTAAESPAAQTDVLAKYLSDLDNKKRFDFVQGKEMEHSDETEFYVNEGPDVRVMQTSDPHARHMYTNSYSASEWYIHEPDLRTRPEPRFNTTDVAVAQFIRAGSEEGFLNQRPAKLTFGLHLQNFKSIVGQGDTVSLSDFLATSPAGRRAQNLMQAIGVQAQSIETDMQRSRISLNVQTRPDAPADMLADYFAQPARKTAVEMLLNSPDFHWRKENRPNLPGSTHFLSDRNPDLPMNLFVNAFSPSTWTVLSIARPNRDRPYFANDVMLAQYANVAKKHGYYGTLPSRFVQDHISNAQSLKFFSEAGPAPDIQRYLKETPNGKYTNRILDALDMHATSLSFDPVSRNATMDIAPNRQPAAKAAAGRSVNTVRRNTTLATGIRADAQASRSSGPPPMGGRPPTARPKEYPSRQDTDAASRKAAIPKDTPAPKHLPASGTPKEAGQSALKRTSKSVATTPAKSALRTKEDGTAKTHPAKARTDTTAKKYGYYGQQPKAIVRDNIVNEATAQFFEQAGSQPDRGRLLKAPPNGKHIQRILEGLGMHATPLQESPEGKQAILSVAPNVAPTSGEAKRKTLPASSYLPVSQAAGKVERPGANLANPPPHLGSHPDYGRRIVVLADNEPLTRQAARRLAAKHANNTVIMQQLPSGELKLLRAAVNTKKGPVKIQLVGHGATADGQPTLGGRDARSLIEGISPLLTDAVSKLSLVACDSGACSGQDLRSQVEQTLQRPEIAVKGYQGKIDIAPEGHKIRVAKGGLGDDDSSSSSSSSTDSDSDSEPDSRLSAFFAEQRQQQQRRQTLQQIFQLLPRLSPAQAGQYADNYLSMMSENQPAAQVLSPHEAIALMHYIHASGDINQALRAQAPSGPVQALIEAADSGARHLIEAGFHNEKGLVHRGQWAQPLEQLEEGGIYVEPAMMSTSENVATARQYLNPQEGPTALLHIAGRGASITPLANLTDPIFDSIQEVLFPSHTPLRLRLKAYDNQNVLRAVLEDAQMQARPDAGMVDALVDYPLYSPEGPRLRPSAAARRHSVTGIYPAHSVENPSATDASAAQAAPTPSPATGSKRPLPAEAASSGSAPPPAKRALPAQAQTSDETIHAAASSEVPQVLAAYLSDPDNRRRFDFVMNYMEHRDLTENPEYSIPGMEVIQSKDPGPKHSYRNVIAPNNWTVLAPEVRTQPEPRFNSTDVVLAQYLVAGSEHGFQNQLPSTISFRLNDSDKQKVAPYADQAAGLHAFINETQAGKQARRLLAGLNIKPSGYAIDASDVKFAFDTSQARAGDALGNYLATPERRAAIDLLTQSGQFYFRHEGGFNYLLSDRDPGVFQNSFTNAYSPDTWIMQANYRRNKTPPYFASDVVLAQYAMMSKAYGYENERPSKIVQENIINTMTLDYLEDTDAPDLQEFLEETPLGKHTQHLLNGLQMHGTRLDWDPDDKSATVHARPND
ncbi:C80 family cysteine peptidase [Bordetella avium]|uniref:C80 family cysteine peptidase n=1 Tax=Bordetella avium TaxID=521 RepID=UPI000E69A1E2|nr:C80 family cysteine peptidase [Bordetella avium]RIQ57883.1 filamentous hemagglutinin N-terminal domain-containing protein [Bordetella avium]